MIIGLWGILMLLEMATYDMLFFFPFFCGGGQNRLTDELARPTSSVARRNSAIASTSLGRFHVGGARTVWGSPATLADRGPTH